MKPRLVLVLCISIFVLAACSTSTKQQDDVLNAQAENTSEEQTTDEVQATGYWQPEVGTPWHYQIGWPVSTTDQFLDDVKVYSIDVFDNKVEDIAFLKSKDIRVICYINVGAWEIWRADASEFPESLKLGNYDNWAGERWLDIRPPEKLNNPADGYKLREIMEARFSEAANRGCDAIEPDNLDSWNPKINLNDGQPREFEVTYDDQIEYNKYLADIAHERGLSIGLKSNVEQAADLVDYYDWALNESCTQFFHPTVAGATECQFYQDTFIPQGKAVFWVEYVEFDNKKEDFCPLTNELEGLSFMLGTLALREDATEVERCDSSSIPAPTPNPTPTPTPVPTPNPNNLLKNANFYDGLTAWELGGCSDNNISINNGNLNLSSGDSCIGQTVSASEELSYDLTCRAKNDNGKYAEMTLYFSDTDGDLISAARLPIINSNYKTLSLSEFSPKGTETVYVSFYGSDADLLIESCVLTSDDTVVPTPTPTPAPTPTPNPDAENLLYNGDFEADLKAWRNPGCGTGIVRTVEGAGVTGAALQLKGDDDCLDQSKEVTTATSYVFSCQAKNIGQNYAELGIYFENQDGVLIRSAATEVTSDSYSLYSVSSAVPEGAVAVIADLYVFESEMFVDDCVLTAEE